MTIFICKLHVPCYLVGIYEGALIKQNDHIKCILCTGVPIMDVESKGGGPGMYVHCMARWNNKK